MMTVAEKLDGRCARALAVLQAARAALPDPDEIATPRDRNNVIATGRALDAQQHAVHVGLQKVANLQKRVTKQEADRQALDNRRAHIVAERQRIGDPHAIRDRPVRDQAERQLQTFQAEERQLAAARTVTVEILRAWEADRDAVIRELTALLAEIERERAPVAAR